MIYRKPMKVGNVEIVYENEIFNLAKDSKKLKERISKLILDIQEKNKMYQSLKYAIENFENLPKYLQNTFKKSVVKYKMDEVKKEMNILIDDLRAFSCFACPVTRLIHKLDIDSQIQDLYSHIASKQADLLQLIGVKNNCEIEQEFDPMYGDKYFGKRIYHNCTGVRMKGKKFDENMILATESDYPINGTEDDIENNKDYLQLEDIEYKKKPIYNIEEQLKAHI